MPKLKKNTPADISAVLSDNVVVRKIRNQTVFSKVTVPKKSKSLKKKKANDRFKDANKWAKNKLKQPGMKELYSKGINSTLSNAHTVAVKDWMVAPKIHYIGLKTHTGAVGDTIRIKVTDDFQVTNVIVTINDSKGTKLETGPAIQYKRKPMMWIYTLTIANPDIKGTSIKVTASDRPGNEVEQEVKIE